MAAAVIIAYLATGCGRRAPDPPEPEPAVTLRLVDHASLGTEIAAHRGKVVVLDCWSTSCPPCVREFPRLVALADKHPHDVVCMSLSFDYEGIGAPADVVPKVRTFLEASGARRVVNLLGSEESDTFAAKLDLVGVPAVFVYGRDGTLLERFDEESAKQRFGRPFTYDDVEATVLSGLSGT
jgi:thiol-disulfide isomerase/thioredoxin